MDLFTIAAIFIGLVVGTAVFIYGAWAWCRFNM